MPPDAEALRTATAAHRQRVIMLASQIVDELATAPDQASLIASTHALAAAIPAGLTAFTKADAFVKAIEESRRADR